MIKTNIIRINQILFVSLMIILAMTPLFRADALSSSSLTLSDGRPSQASSYTLSSSSFTTGTSINCIQLDIGTAVDGTGDAGLTVTGATLGTNTIPSAGTWTVSVVDGTTDQLRATSAGGATPNASGSITWDNVTNGSTADTTYFALFETYANVDCSTGGPVDSAVVTFIYKNGALVSLTIDPTLTFTVAGVATSTAVNGVNTTITTTPTAVDYGNSVTTLANGVSAHDLTVGTNAGSYALYIRHTGLLTNGSSDTIDNLIGATNAAPLAFAAPGTEAWGYTTEDSTLSGGTANRFTNGGDFWAAFNTTNEIVADGAGPTGGDTYSVGHQVGISAGTEAGTYQTTIVYTAASTY